ncbi:MAG: sulfatase-like hydrolase/transferase, partial [Planctomycetota bacterium]
MSENAISRRDLLRRFAAGAAAAAVPTVLAGNNTASRRPNILFLLADDQRSDTIRAYGNKHIRTPNLDKLVARGFNFRGNYCLGSNGGAVCVPSRAMIHSGQAYFNVDSRLTGVKIMPQLLRENGYTTFATGKWHNREPSFLRGFEKGKAIFFGGMADHTKVPVVDLSPAGRMVNKRTGDKFSSELFTNAAIEFLENYKEDKPFFAYVAFTAPHDPRNPPPKYRQMYYRNRPPLPKNFMPQHPFDNGHMVGRDESLAPWPRTEEIVRDQLAEYYGLITHLDEHIGRVLKTLEESPHAENTLIIYAADHGLALGSHGLLGKQSIYEHSMGCPLIFAGPGIPRGGSTQAFSYLLDIFP